MATVERYRDPDNDEILDFVDAPEHVFEDWLATLDPRLDHTLRNMRYGRIARREWYRKHGPDPVPVPPKHPRLKAFGVGIYWILVSILVVIGAFLVIGWFGLVAWGAQH